jgi:hypothetical protein
MEQVELSSLDLRYVDCRLKSHLAEKTLLASILESGIRDPLQGVDVDGQRILLAEKRDGRKSGTGKAGREKRDAH